MLLAVERTLAGSIESGVLEAYDQQVIGMPSALAGSMPGGMRVEGALYAVTAARWLIQQAVRGKDLPGSTLKRSQTLLGLAGGYVATASVMEPSASDAVRETSPGGPSPSVQPASREVLQQHVCIACVECGKCSCRTPAGPGVCEMCQRIRLVRMRAKEDIARYKDQMAKGHVYVLTSNRLHRWNCKSLPSVDGCLSQLDFIIRHARKSKNDNAARHLDWPALPALLTAQELRAKKSRRPSCGMCKPEPL